MFDKIAACSGHHSAPAREGFPQERYEYDPYGNRAIRDTGTESYLSSYDPAQQFTEIHDAGDDALVASFTYDAPGNMTGETRGAESLSLV